MKNKAVHSHLFICNPSEFSFHVSRGTQFDLKMLINSTQSIYKMVAAFYFIFKLVHFSSKVIMEKYLNFLNVFFIDKTSEYR